MNPFFIIILLAGAGVLADIFIKLAGSGPKAVEMKWFAAGFLIYASTAFGWFYVMKHVKLSSLGAIYAVSTILLLVAVGVFYFHEKINLYEIIGIALALISVVLLAKFA